MEKYEYIYNGSEGYCYPGTDVLKNKLGIRDENALIVAEREITSLKILMLYNSPILTKKFNFDILCRLHKKIFEDIYEWAGKIRHGDFFSKGNSIFCRGQYIMENANKIIENLQKENFLYGLKKFKFIEKTAYYMGEINALHPFREGNGRTSREFFRQLSLYAGYILDFNKTEKEALLTADIEAFNGKYEGLIKILEKILTEN
ncbi:MAG: Fic family protein [Treponema sp.]|nr:Fic family protein [Treponema sp.]